MGESAKKYPVFPLGSDSSIQKSNSTEEYRDLFYEFFMDRPYLTARSYRIDLRKFFEFTTENFNVPSASDLGIHFEKVKRVHVVKFKNYLQKCGGRSNKPAAPGTIIRKLAAIKVFYDFLITKEKVETNPASAVLRPRAVVLHETQDLTDDETRALFAKIQSYGSSALPLHLAVITTLFTTGIRQSELRGLKRKDLKTEDGIYFVEFIGKRQNKCKVALHPTTSHNILKYLEWMNERGRGHSKDDPLFQPTTYRAKKNAVKKHLSASGVRYIVEHYSKMIVPDKRITPHSARATLIGSLLDSGEDIYNVSQAVNHSSTQTTEKYNKRKKKIKNSPLLNLKFYNKK